VNRSTEGGPHPHSLPKTEREAVRQVEVGSHQRCCLAKAAVKNILPLMPDFVVKTFRQLAIKTYRQRCSDSSSFDCLINQNSGHALELSLQRESGEHESIYMHYLPQAQLENIL